MAKTTVRVHNDIPWPKLMKLWDAGKTYEQIAKAINRYNPKSDDPTKPTRAIVSRGLNFGFTNADGKLVKLQPREGMRAIGMGKKAPKVKTSTKAKLVAKTAGRKSKAIVIALDETGKLIRVESPKPKALVPVANLIPSFVDVLSKLGYSVAKTEAVAATVPAADVLPAEMPSAPEQTEPEVTASASSLPQVTQNDQPIQPNQAA